MITTFIKASLTNQMVGKTNIGGYTYILKFNQRDASLMIFYRYIPILKLIEKIYMIKNYKLSSGRNKLCFKTIKQINQKTYIFHLI